MKKYLLIMSLVLCVLGLVGTVCAAPGMVPNDYLQELSYQQDHKFTDNQIRSFVYYWYGLHDKHEPVKDSLVLLDMPNLSMTFPEQVVHDQAGYELWYANVGKNIQNNLHRVKKLEVTFLPDHKYKLNVVVNWRAVDKDGNFIDVDATQEWLLVDGDSDRHPYVQQYNVLQFSDNLSKVK